MDFKSKTVKLSGVNYFRDCLFSLTLKKTFCRQYSSSTTRLKNLNKGFKLCSTCTHSVIGRKLVNASFYHISNRKVNPWQDISSKKHCIYLLCNYVYLVRLELSSKQWKRRISCQKLSPSNFLADDLTFTFYFVSGKVSSKVQRIGKLIPGKMTKINEE